MTTTAMGIVMRQVDGGAAGAGAPPRVFADVGAMTAGVAAGEAAHVDAFYRAYFDVLYAEARRATRRDEAFCLDVVHDAVLRVLRTIRRVDDEPQLRRWLKLVVRTTAYDLLRRERRWAGRDAAVATPETLPPVDAAGDEQLRWLRDQVAALDPELARLVELRYERRWTLSRIGAAVGLSLGAVDRRLRRALRTLRDAARAAYPEEVDDVG